MELALSLGDAPKPFSFLDEPQKMVVSGGGGGGGLGFCMGVGGKSSTTSTADTDQEEDQERRGSSSDPPVQLDLLPFSPVPRSQTKPGQLLSFSWLTQNLTVGAEPASSNGPGRRVEVNRRSSLGVGATEEGTTALSSPNSTATASSFQMEFPIYRNGRSNTSKRDLEPNEGASSRASDEDENGMMARKKLRLSKEQSAFLEESFKEHNTLNPKQKVALAKQLNLRPRQVEVWFQNRRARTKLKQTEVDCEHLKRCCETLTEENRRLQKELQELRALKSSQPFYMQLPATTLTMCPSCERVATTTTATSTVAAAANIATPAAACTAANTTLSLAKPRELLPFATSKVHHQATKAAAS